ncbi:unnamed protein product [Hymenolepis diminuta]|uniref:Uncharacterized protein n=1 Tax=Hymenolepis diminuta TaxID=6216 RepID=A0A564Z6H1_HYMDI|nr:unnamed protein product [Hymenolepis diminuta]
MLWRGLTQVTHIKLPLFFQTAHTDQGGLLHYAALPLCYSLWLPRIHFGLLNSWCSASQLLLALTQRATNWLS